MTKTEWSQYFRHLGRVRLRYCRKENYPKWVADGANTFIYYLSPQSWEVEAYSTSTGEWKVYRRDTDAVSTARSFEDVEDALKYGEVLATQRREPFLRSSDIMLEP